jgi:hypothetical protein
MLRSVVERVYWCCVVGCRDLISWSMSFKSNLSGWAEGDGRMRWLLRPMSGGAGQASFVSESSRWLLSVFFARRLHFICHLPSCSGNSLTGHLGKWNAHYCPGASGAKAKAKARFQPRGASFWSARTRRACLFQNFKLFQNFLFLHQHIHSSLFPHLPVAMPERSN